MLERYAHVFCDLQWRLWQSERQATGLLHDGHETLPDWLEASILEELQVARLNCQRISLDGSLKKIARLEVILDRPKTGLALALPVSARDVQTRLRELRETIDDELASQLFLFVPTAKAGSYEHLELFGVAVATKFVKAAFHIREAGTCLALARSTATVYHAMCVLEVGLDSLAAALNLPHSEKNWNTILEDIKGKIDALPTSGPMWKQDKDWYSDAALELKFFRDAWRNHTAHGRAKFTESEAANILEHVKVFMQHLATRLQDRP